MHVDLKSNSEMKRKLRQRRVRGPGARLLKALMQLAEGEAELVRHSERPWASITFSGTRHTVMLAFAGDDTANAAEAFIAALPDHEFTIPGQLVADAAIVSVDHALQPEPRLTVEAELLMLEEC